MTDQDFSSREKRQQFSATVNTLLKIGIVPVLNENDVMSSRTTPLVDQDNHIFWDNDRYCHCRNRPYHIISIRISIAITVTISVFFFSLATLVASVMDADLEILLTDVDGLFDAPPSSIGRRKPTLMSVCRNNSAIQIGEKSRVGRGGMQAKIDAALDAVERGVGVGCAIAIPIPSHHRLQCHHRHCRHHPQH